MSCKVEFGGRCPGNANVPVGWRMKCQQGVAYGFFVGSPIRRADEDVCAPRWGRRVGKGGGRETLLTHSGAVESFSTPGEELIPPVESFSLPGEKPIPPVESFSLPGEKPIPPVESFSPLGEELSPFG